MEQELELEDLEQESELEKFKQELEPIESELKESKLSIKSWKNENFMTRNWRFELIALKLKSWSIRSHI